MPDKTWAILLDLDQTLVLTSAIEHLRRQRAWQQATSSFAMTTLPPQTREFIQTASKVGQLGIVTNTPRSYAEKLLTYHRLAIPVLVAYHDTSLHKPHPQPILKAAEMLRLPPHQCIYIGDTVPDILAAGNAKAIPIALTWDGLLDHQEAIKRAKAFCKSWTEVLTTITTIVGGFPQEASHAL